MDNQKKTGILSLEEVEAEEFKRGIQHHNLVPGYKFLETETLAAELIEQCLCQENRQKAPKSAKGLVCDFNQYYSTSAKCSIHSYATRGSSSMQIHLKPWILVLDNLKKPVSR